MISIIAAMTRKRVIGKSNRLPWRIKEEMDNFRKLTIGNVVVMGRKTFESIGKPLADRKNIIISRTGIDAEGIDVCPTIDEGLKKAEKYGKEIFIIGGASIYEQTISIADKMYISYIKREYEGDAYFPEFNQKEWDIERKEDYNEFELVVYRRKPK